VSEYVSSSEYENWNCGHCHVPLEIKPVQIEYLGSAFPVDLPICPRCGQVFIPESLALGKMAEVEKSLEDK
jgi:ribosomal protein S27AE